MTHLVLITSHLPLHSLDLGFQPPLLFERLQVLSFFLGLLIAEFLLVRPGVFDAFPESFRGSISDLGPFLVFLLTGDSMDVREKCEEEDNTMRMSDLGVHTLV
jgi:hypothetical protein